MSIIKEWLSDAEDEVKEQWEDIVEPVINIFEETVEWVIEQTEDLVTGLINIGSDLVDIVIEGVEDSIDYVVETWNDLPEWVKIALIVTTIIVVLAVTNVGFAIGNVMFWAVDMVVLGYEYVILLISVWGSDIAQAIRDLLRLTSEDYREFENKVYGYLGEAAEYIGVSADFLRVMIHDISVLSTSTLAVFGIDYEVGKIQSVVTTSEYLQKFGEQMEIYKANPNQIFIDMDAWIVSPLVDMKAGFQRDFLQNVDSFSKNVKETAAKVTTVMQDVDTLVHDLPARIGKDIWEDIEPYINKINDKIANEIAPNIKILNASVDVLNGGQKQHEYKIKNMKKTLFNPGYLMREIDELEEKEREKQEDIIGEISLRGMVRSLKGANEEIEGEVAGIEKKYNESIKKRDKEEKKYKETTSQIMKPKEIAYEKPGWFVGEY
jgi:outer membrane murein-binding lipoprotein Lpp